MKSSEQSSTSPEDKSISKWFGVNLATLLGEKILAFYPKLDIKKYIEIISLNCEGKSYTQRIQLHTETLRQLLQIITVKQLKF
jgi:hypothetical protein